MYRDVREPELPQLDGVRRANKPQRLPVGLTPDQVWRVLSHLEGKNWIAASLLYGAGFA